MEQDSKEWEETCRQCCAYDNQDWATVQPVSTQLQTLVIYLAPFSTKETSHDTGSIL